MSRVSKATVKPLAFVLAGALGKEGYRPGPPAGLTEEAGRIDAEACLEMLCPHCRAAGLDYRPYHKGRSYRALAVCKRCGFAEEF